MKKLIMLSSITYAMKAKQFLEHKGIKVYVEKTPAELTKCGCGYSVRLRDDLELDPLVEMLKGAGIKVVGSVIL